MDRDADVVGWDADSFDAEVHYKARPQNIHLIYAYTNRTQ